MSLALKEQLDRRFIFGLLLCGTKLSVWLCDKSGLLGTDKVIDINEVRISSSPVISGPPLVLTLPFSQQEPKRFIQIIMALSCLEPARLGWDPDMRIYHPSSNSFVPTTDGSITVNEFSRGIYNTRWAIRVKGRWYFTLKALSAIRAANIYGRGTLVWTVVQHDTEKVKRLFVLLSF